MYRKIRITVVSLVAMTVCVFSSTGTLSYFTDTDARTNDFTVGNASTALVVYDDVTGDRHEIDVEGCALLSNETEKPSYCSPLEVGMEIPFYLQATNDGNIPVYQRFRVVIPIGLADVVTLKSGDSDCTVANACDNDAYDVTYESDVDGQYAEYYIVSKAKLAVGGKTGEWPTTEIYIGDISGVGDIDDIATCTNGNNNKCVFGVKAYSDAIQTTGFTNAIDAFEGLEETY